MAARILVADDSVTIQKVVELTFSKEDFVLVQARSGEEAIRKAKEERPDLVLVDLVMPDKNGYEVCAALRAEPALRAVPIILLTGTFETVDKDKGIQAGANDFVTKPFESQVLISKVKQLLFAKTVDMAATAVPVGPGRAAPPKEPPRPVPTAAPPPPAGVPPRPGPAPAPPRGVAPGVMRGVVPPSPAPTATPPRTAAVPPRPPAPSPAPIVPQPPKPVTPAPTRPVARMAAVPPEKPAPAKPAPPPSAAPPMPGRTLDLSPPTEEISQDRVRRVMEPTPSPPPPSAPGGFGELTLEDLTTLPMPEAPGRPADLHLELERAAAGPPPVPGELSLEMPSLEPEPVQEEKAAPTPEVGAAGLPESLSLEELLSAEPTAAPLVSKPGPAPLEELPGGPVFDLTSEMEGPSLPLVEVGTGEPPALSIEDLLAPMEAAPPPPLELGAIELAGPGPEAPTEELPGGPLFELTSETEAPPPPLVEAGAGELPTLSIEDLLQPEETAPVGPSMVGLPELELELIPGAPAEGPLVKEEAPTAAAPLDLGALVEVPLTESERIGLEAALIEGKAPAPPSVVPPSIPAMKAAAVVAEVPPAAVTPAEIAAAPPIAPAAETAPPIAVAMPLPGGAEALLPEMAAMRQEVTERVAHELARELSDKLLERIERIVWEVVPDLAEILITKEIERIRALAEGKQSS